MHALPVIYSAGTYDSREHDLPGSKTPLRTVNCYEVEWYAQDGGVSIWNDCEYPIRAGMLLVVCPGDTRRSTLPFCNRFIRLVEVDDHLRALLQGVAGVTVMEDTDAVEAMMAHIGDWFMADDAYSRAAASAELLLLLRMVRMHRTQWIAAPREGDVVARAHQYIDQHYQEELSVEELARACHVSTPYLHRLFVQHLGVTPHHALMRRRIMAAKVMLINDPCPIAEVAWRCGFQSASYFSDCFRKWVGMSPKKFRRETGYQI